MKIAFPPRLAVVFGLLGCFSQNEKNFSFWKSFFVSFSAKLPTLKSEGPQPRAGKYGFLVFSHNQSLYLKVGATAWLPG